MARVALPIQAVRDVRWSPSKTVTTSGTPPERWLAYREPNPRARLRMFCFPYAGGGASAYRGWGASLPADVELCPVQLPGRESRLRDKPFTRPEPLIATLAEVLLPYMDMPFVFFGHSMGGMIGFELSRELRRRGRALPLHLFVSGRRAPQQPAREENIHDLPEPQFIAKLRELNGTPEEVLQHAELMRLLIPILRADFAINETYAFTGEEPFDFGISAFGGLGDVEVLREDVALWQIHTRGRFRLRMLPGDHFFLHSAKDLITEAVARDLAELDVQAAPPLR
ncbi:MAG: thioesterase domain-containing protein [Acidobacteriota bacterium]|nr:thioesterase domain-containing protein [Acidobacteriota bacterium]